MYWCLYKYCERLVIIKLYARAVQKRYFKCIPINIEDHIKFATVGMCNSTNPYEAIMFEFKKKKNQTTFYQPRISEPLLVAEFACDNPNK